MSICSRAAVARNVPNLRCLSRSYLMLWARRKSAASSRVIHGSMRLASLKSSIYAAEAARFVVDLAEGLLPLGLEPVAQLLPRDAGRTAASSLPRSGDDVSGLK